MANNSLTHTPGTSLPSPGNLELGYYFHPSQYPGLHIVHPQLDINVYDEPTGQHFDPMWASFWIVVPEGDLERLFVTHPWHGEQRLRLGAGRVILGDHKGKVVEAYTFGGDLAIDPLARPEASGASPQGTAAPPARTHLSLTSPAPIFELAGTHTVSTILVSEFESSLARKHARWGRDDLGFESRLASADPFLLFAAGLTAIDQRLDHLSHKAHADLYRETQHTIKHIIHTLRRLGVWPASPPTLDDLL